MSVIGLLHVLGGICTHIAPLGNVGVCLEMPHIFKEISSF